MNESPTSDANAGVDEKRILRSQDDSVKPKSDLAYFFPNYDEIVRGNPDEPDLLTVDTPIIIVDRNLPSRNLAIRSPPAPQQQLVSTFPSKTLRKAIKSVTRVTTKPNGTFHGFERIDFAAARKNAASLSGDPLNDEAFSKSHKRAERREKNLRNIERDRAMHEKNDLDRLLAELRGPEWTRTMGISAITDTEKRNYEPKRQYMIRCIQALIQKFTEWKDKEKEMKLRKVFEANNILAEAVEESEAFSSRSSVSEFPDDDADASAARQLQLEAQLRVAKASLATVSDSREEKPFTSFFKKTYLRQAALGAHRRGRSVHAFGQPLPELPSSQEFNLPAEYITEEALDANARKRRRLKRQSKEEE